MNQLVDRLFTNACSKGDSNMEKRNYFIEKTALAVCKGGIDKETVVMLVGHPGFPSTHRKADHRCAEAHAAGGTDLPHPYGRSGCNACEVCAARPHGAPAPPGSASLPGLPSELDRRASDPVPHLGNRPDAPSHLPPYVAPYVLRARSPPSGGTTARKAPKHAPNCRKGP